MTNRLLLILSAVLLSLAVAAACGEAETDAGGESGVAAAGDAAAAILPLETFLTNINDPNHEKHARVQVKLAITPKAAAADIEADALLTARLHDRVLTLLTTKTYPTQTIPWAKSSSATRFASSSTPCSSKARSRKSCFPISSSSKRTDSKRSRIPCILTLATAAAAPKLW